MKETNEIALNAQMAKVQSNEERFEELQEKMELAYGDTIDEMVRHFDSLFELEGFEYSFKEFLEWRGVI